MPALDPFTMNARETHCMSKPLQHEFEDLAPNRLREECIIALKIYDSCRQQDCMTFKELGVVRHTEDGNIGAWTFDADDKVVPPDDAVVVAIDDLRVKKINVVSKKPNALKTAIGTSISSTISILS